MKFWIQSQGFDALKGPHVSSGHLWGIIPLDNIVGIREC